MAARASIVGAAETSVGKVRDHNEDAHFMDPDLGIFIVCDGMGGHAAGEVASALAVQTIRTQWAAESLQSVIDHWLEQGTAAARKQLLTTVELGVIAAHEAIMAEGEVDRGKQGMGTTVVAAMVVGGDIVFAHCGDSRAYLVRDGITVQLTEDHTLLARLLAAGVDVDVDGDGARFKSMLTNALGIGHEAKVSTFVVPVADGDRFLLCSDGITEYLEENEIGEVLTKMPSPARSAQRLVEIALERGGGDNATAVVIRVLEAGETARPKEQLRREELVVNSCPLWARVNPQQRLRALRIAVPRDYAAGEKVPAQTLGDRVAWIVIEGELDQDNFTLGAGALLYPEALLADRPLPDKEGLAIARTDVRVLALRADDFRELCDDDPELAEHLLESLGSELARRRPQRRTGKVAVQFGADERGVTDPGEDIARADTGQFTALDQSGNPVTHARQPRASTVPPHTVRPRSNTEPGIPVPERPPASPEPAASPAEPAAETTAAERGGAPRLSRGSTPPAEARASLFVAPADTEAAVEEALTGITSGPVAAAPATAAPKPIKKPLAGGPVEAASPPLEGMHLSEPEIHIEELVEMVADEPDEPERSAPPVTAAPAEESSARIVEILKDTSSQTITLSIDPDVEIEPLVAADSDPPRAKRQTDAPD